MGRLGDKFLADPIHSPHIAQREIKLIRSPQGDKRNIRIMRARGLSQACALWALEKIRNGEIAYPDTFIWNCTKNPNNLDPNFLRQKQSGYRERHKARRYDTATEAIRINAAYSQSEEHAFSQLPDLIQDDEVRLPKPKKKKKQGPPATPGRERDAMAAMRKIRAASDYDS